MRNGQLVDVFNERIYRADLAIADGVILGTGNYRGEKEVDLRGRIVSPAFIDGHLHLESAMVRVEEFARTVIPRGTVTILADPHEIANVAGIKGIKYLLENGRVLPWNFLLMLPSSVPATPYETSGAELNAEDLAPLFEEPGVFGLGEVMDYKGVINGEQRIWDNITTAGSRFIDGHAPEIRGRELNTYLLAGIRADHECTTPAEALEKVRKGMYIMIREGSVTRDLSSLLPAVNEENCSRFIFATDDRHPGDLLQEGHIDFLIRKAVSLGMPPIRALRLATINAALALGIKKLGALAPGFRADLLVLDNLEDLKVEEVYWQGKLTASAGEPLFEKGPGGAGGEDIFQSVRTGPLKTEGFELPPGRRYLVMELKPDQLLTEKQVVSLKYGGRERSELIAAGLVKVAVVERHRRTGNTGLGLLKGFGLKKGAIASTVAHDSHNIIVAGLSGQEMLRAVRELERMQGGIVIVEGDRVLERLPLPIAGLLSCGTVKEVASRLKVMRELSLSLGVVRENPFMTLSFMALPVIPEIKLTDYGLYDSSRGKIVPITVSE